MSRLSFRLPFETRESQGLDLPIEIRKPNLALVARSLATESVDVPPGTYVVSGRLPGGQELSAQVTVGRRPASVMLQLEEGAQGDVGGMRDLEEFPLRTNKSYRLHFAEDKTTEVTPLGSVEVTMGLLRGSDPRTAQRTRFPSVEPTQASTGVQFRIEGTEENSLQFVEFLRPRRPALVVGLPVSFGRTGLVVVRRPSSQKSDLTVRVHLPNAEADLLLSGLSSGYLREASEALSSRQVSAEELLSDKGNDPFAAAVGAYALLQFGELDRLHDWTGNLMNWFRWLPDGLAIRGEHLARLGKHSAAVEALAAIPSRGIPQFTLGISYAINRLRVYTQSADWIEPVLHQNDLHQAACTALRYLTEISQHVDFSQPVLTTRGVRSDAEFPSGVEISRFL